jgi:hypothetical protein
MSVSEYLPLNLELMRVPQNWVIVALIVLLAGLSLAYIMHPGQSQEQSS